ncbi:MAG TPA: hypothetical protein DCY07_07180 [Rhodospirillaceae bacterium]|nr:hypothetical protein [Rhodospirillaceae bacterium]
MNIRNFNPAALDEMDIAAIATLATPELAELIDLIDKDATLLKLRKDKLACALNRKYGDAAQKARINAGKDTGVVHIDDADFDVAAEVGKTVKWDQEKLIAVLNALPTETAKHYAKAEFKVDERKYAAAPPDIQKILAPARAVVPSRATYTLKRKAKE